MIKIFLAGPEIQILSLKMTFYKLQALVRPAEICIFWEYTKVNSEFSLEIALELVKLSAHFWHYIVFGKSS